MRIQDQGLAGALEAEAIYSVGTLARIGNVSADRMRRLLRSNGVKMVRIGRVLAVSLADVKRRIPPLWDSLCLIERLRRGLESSPPKAERDTRGRASRARKP
jgi:hypothetical protein